MAFKVQKEREKSDKILLKKLIQKYHIGYARTLKSEKFSWLLSKINKKFKNFPALPLNTKLFWFLNDIKSYPKCEICGKELRKTKCHPIKGYVTKYCSSRCAHKSDEYKKKLKEKLSKYNKKEALRKRKETCLKKYGYENVSQNKEIHQKVLKTFAKHTRKEIDKSVRQRKATKLQRYGDENYFDKEKSKQTRQKYQQEDKNYLTNIIEKRKQTCLKKYGTTCSVQTEEIKQKQVFNHYYKYYHNVLITNQDFSPLFSFDEYFSIRNSVKLKWKCNHCGKIFESKVYDKNRFLPRCYSCFPKRSSISKEEKQLISYLKSIYKGKIKTSTRKVISPQELDIYLPEKKIAIEFDGLYWHSDKNGTAVDYHLNKTEQCEAKEINLIHIFEDEWKLKQNLVKNYFKQILDLVENKVSIEKCEVKQIFDKLFVNNFLSENQLQDIFSFDICFGVYFNDKLIKVMCFKQQTNYFEIVNICDKVDYYVENGNKCLLDNFKEKYQCEKFIINFDRRFLIDKSFEDIGFKEARKIIPNFYYWNYKKKQYKENIEQSQKLFSKISNYNNLLSEKENMHANGYACIYNCGYSVYEKTYF